MHDAGSSPTNYDDEFKVGRGFVADFVHIGPSLASGYLGTTGFFINGRPFAGLNRVSFADPDMTLDHVEDVLAHVESFDVPFGVDIPFSAQSRVASAFAAHGLEPAEPSPVMLLDDVAQLAKYRDLPELVTELVTESNYPAFVSIMSEVFNFPTHILEYGWPDMFPVKSGRMPIRLAYVDGELAGVAQARVYDGAIGIYNVGVAEGFRGRGLGRTLTHASLADGIALGGTFAFLGATDMGYALYKSMGFRDAGFRVGYSPHAAADGATPEG